VLDPGENLDLRGADGPEYALRVEELVAALKGERPCAGLPGWVEQSCAMRLLDACCGDHLPVAAGCSGRADEFQSHDGPDVVLDPVLLDLKVWVA
jgi:hypothetical protein